MLPGAHPSLACSCSPTRTSLFPDAGRSVSNLNGFCWWTVLLSEPCCSDPLPWATVCPLGSLGCTWRLLWCLSPDMERAEGCHPTLNMVCITSWFPPLPLFAMGRWQFLFPVSSNAFGIFERGFENPEGVVHENITCVCSCKHNALLRTMIVYYWLFRMSPSFCLPPVRSWCSKLYN